MAAWLLLLLSSSVVPVTKSDLSCGSCDLKNVTLTFVDNHLQVLDTQQQQHQIPVHHHSHPPHFLANVTRCMGKCEKESGLVCRPTLTSLQTLAVPVPWNLPRHDFDFHPSSISVTLAVEEHKSCRCVDQNSINVTLNVDLRLREVLESQEKEKLSREIRSVAPTISNAIITTRATSSDNRGAAAGGGTDVSYSNPRRVKAGIVTNDEREFGPDGIGVKPTEHEIVYYKTCLACREQQELCRVNGQIYDSEVCHCVYPASRTFLNSFYTLGVVMLTVMVCCFLVFGVQKGDENVLNSSRRSTRRCHSSQRHHHSRRCSSAHGHQSSRRYSSRCHVDMGDVERSNDCIGLNGNTRRTSSITNPNVNASANVAVNNEINNPNVNAIVANNTTNPDSIVVNNEAHPHTNNQPSAVLS